MFALWMDLEMSRIKQLEKEIAELKELVSGLQQQITALRLTQPVIITQNPAPPYAPPYPYVPYVPPIHPIITCGKNSSFGL